MCNQVCVVTGENSKEEVRWIVSAAVTSTRSSEIYLWSYR